MSSRPILLSRLSTPSKFILTSHISGSKLHKQNKDSKFQRTAIRQTLILRRAMPVGTKSYSMPERPYVKRSELAGLSTQTWASNAAADERRAGHSSSSSSTALSAWRLATPPPPQLLSSRRPPLPPPGFVGSSIAAATRY